MKLYSTKFILTALLFTSLIGCSKENTAPQYNNLVHRFIVDNQVYEYEYNGNQLTRIIYPNGDICQFVYNDTAVNYTISNYISVFEKGYYKTNSFGNYAFKCAYRDNDTARTIYTYNKDQRLIKDSTWSRSKVSFNNYHFSDIFKSSTTDNINYSCTKIIQPTYFLDDYANTIDWHHNGLTQFGKATEDIPLHGTLNSGAYYGPMTDNFPWDVDFGYETFKDIEYTYTFDSKNRIIERRTTDSFIITVPHSIRIEYVNE